MLGQERLARSLIQQVGSRIIPRSHLLGIALKSRLVIVVIRVGAGRPQRVLNDLRTVDAELVKRSLCILLLRSGRGKGRFRRGAFYLESIRLLLHLDTVFANHEDRRNIAAVNREHALLDEIPVNTLTGVVT